MTTVAKFSYWQIADRMLAGVSLAICLAVVMMAFTVSEFPETLIAWCLLFIPIVLIFAFIDRHGEETLPGALNLTSIELAAKGIGYSRAIEEDGLLILERSWQQPYIGDHRRITVSKANGRTRVVGPRREVLKLLAAVPQT